MGIYLSPISFFSSKILLVYFYREGKGGGRRERNISVWQIHRSVASHKPPTEDVARNPGMCPDWELNRWTFSLQAGTLSTEPHQPGLISNFIKLYALNVNRLLCINTSIMWFFTRIKRMESGKQCSLKKEPASCGNGLHYSPSLPSPWLQAACRACGSEQTQSDSRRPAAGVSVSSAPAAGDLNGAFARLPPSAPCIAQIYFSVQVCGAATA